MNIAFVLSQKEVTGAEVYAATLADELIRRGHRVLIVSDTFARTTEAEYLSLHLNNRSLFNRIKQITFLVKLIRERDIEVVHAHSRASGWVSFFAAKISSIPLVTTVHGRQHVHISRKIVKAFGDHVIAVCENVEEHLVKDLNVKPAYIEVLRNGMDLRSLKNYENIESPDNAITIAGRLSGPKGDVIYQVLKHAIVQIPDVKINLVGGGDFAPERFTSLDPRINLTGHLKDLAGIIKNSTMLIGSGRIAIEGIALGVPTIAIGENCSIGLITESNIKDAAQSNFGDIGLTKTGCFDFQRVSEEVKYALKAKPDVSALKRFIESEFDLSKVVDRVESIYTRVSRDKKEIPVLTYHRVVEKRKDAGKEGIYVFKKRFERQMKYLSQKGLVPITFKQYSSYDKRSIILTFDDGYEDVYRIAFPILKKYGFVAVVFLVADRTQNQWDSAEPQARLLSPEKISEMKEYGIEFGSHTLTHPHLTGIDEGKAEEEIFGSKTKIEQIIQDKVTSFAYPYGELNDQVKELVKNAGYRFAVATDSGPPFIDDDLFRIRRIQVFPGTSKFSFKHKVSGSYFWRRI
ncbi:MAG: polysaccharide deacetylase family protein [Candidatus Zixiibacteriota bacterium]